MTEKEKPPVHEALSAVMDDVRAVRKDQRNPDQGYVFRGIDSVVNAVGPALRSHGVVVLPMLEHASYRDVRTSRDKPAREVTVQVRYRFYGPAGDYLDSVVPGESLDSGDKGTAKAMSVALRIALLQALALPTDEADSDSQTYERAPVPVNHESSEADKARRRVREYCDANGIKPPDVAEHFKAQTEQDIRQADAETLDAYLETLKEVGLTSDAA